MVNVDNTLRQQMEDRYQIEEVLRQYSRGVDQGDVGLIRGVYHQDALDDHGTFSGSGQDFAEQLVANTKRRWLAAQHLLHQSNIRFAENVAWVETYFTAHHRVLGDGDAAQLETFGGRYVDRFEKRNARWAIAKRVVVYDWSRIENIAREYPHAEFEQGQRSTQDLSYQDI